MHIDVVIVNWNAGSLLKDCIDSVITHANGKVSRIIIVDNGSTDGSVKTIENLPKVEVVRAGENLGFGAACNKGAELCGSAYILFLNPDTRIESGSLTVPLNFMDHSDNAHVGICGIQLIDESGKPSRSCARFPSMTSLIASSIGLDKLSWFKGSGLHMRDWDHSSSAKVPHVIGAFYLIRRSLFEMVGGFDERFFVYLEDLDLSYRVNNAGFDSWYLTEAKAFHAGGGTSQQVKAKRLFYALRSRILYAFKHFPAWQTWLLLIVTIVVEPFTRSIWSILRGDLEGLRQIWSAYGMLWRSMAQIIRGEGRCNP